jgi:hypothetical protein
MATQPRSELKDLPVTIPRQRDNRGAVRLRRTFWVGPLAAMLGYAVLRAIGIVVLAIGAGDRDRPLTGPLLRADAGWYLGIAEYGYDHALTYGPYGQVFPSNLAFFPLFPALIVAVAWAFSITAPAASLVVAWTAGLVAAAGLYAVGTVARDRRTGVFLAMVWAIVPHAVVESMGYSETLFTALSAWSLWAVLRARWLTAAVLCLLAGLTRPTAVALIAAVGVAALVAGIRNPRKWQAWSAIVISPLGLLAFIWWVGHRLHRTDGYFYVQNVAWHMGFDGGAYTLKSAGRILSENVLQMSYMVTTMVLIAAIALMLAAVGARIPWPLLVFAGVALVVVITGDGYYYAKARLLLPVFPLLLPIALALSRTRNRVAPVAVVVALAFLSSTYGIHLGLVSKYSP